MNKQELLDSLTVDFAEVGNPRLLTIPELPASIKAYAVMLVDVSGDIASRRNVEFMVDDEGGAGEAAYWLSAKPKTQAVASLFDTDLKTFITAKIADGTIAAAFVIDDDFINEKATIRAYRQVAGQWHEVKALLSRNATTGNIEQVILDTVIT